MVHLWFTKDVPLRCCKGLFKTRCDYQTDRCHKKKVHWVKASQLRLLKSDNYEHLSKSLSLKFDKENIIRCYGHETENKHPIMLSRNHDLAKLLVLKCHEKVLHNGVKQTLNELRNEFWINRGRNYIQKLLIICFICKHLKSGSYSYPEKSNLPGYRVNRTVPFQVWGVNYLGTVFVKDIYHSSNDEMHKAYIVYLHVVRQKQLYLIWLRTILVKTLLIYQKIYSKKVLSKEYCVCIVSKGVTVVYLCSEKLFK